MLKSGKIKTNIPNKAFIDGQNLETGLANSGLEIDIDLFFSYLLQTYKVTEVYYFIKFSRNPEREKYFEQLKKIGYRVVFSSGMGNSRIDGSHKVNVDADLILKAVEEYFRNGRFGLILVSGDGDFIPLIRFFEKEKEFVKIITADKESASKMLAFDRYTRTKRYLVNINSDLPKLTKKISPPRGSGGN